ncbi:unnamed protein product [Amoebophrya sp. A120]|nr:unnamed protein product [Amoebophrya sp. A120]|eukprot:GSA120T00001557001.1
MLFQATPARMQQLGNSEGDASGPSQAKAATASDSWQTRMKHALFETIPMPGFASSAVKFFIWQADNDMTPMLPQMLPYMDLDSEPVFRAICKVGDPELLRSTLLRILEIPDEAQNRDVRQFKLSYAAFGIIVETNATRHLSLETLLQCQSEAGLGEFDAEGFGQALVEVVLGSSVDVQFASLQKLCSVVALVVGDSNAFPEGPEPIRKSSDLITSGNVARCDARAGDVFDFVKAVANALESRNVSEEELRKVMRVNMGTENGKTTTPTGTQHAAVVQHFVICYCEEYTSNFLERVKNTQSPTASDGSFPTQNMDVQLRAQAASEREGTLNSSLRDQWAVPRFMMELPALLRACLPAPTELTENSTTGDVRDSATETGTVCRLLNEERHDAFARAFVQRDLLVALRSTKSETERKAILSNDITQLGILAVIRTLRADIPDASLRRATIANLWLVAVESGSPEVLQRFQGLFFSGRTETGTTDTKLTLIRAVGQLAQVFKAVPANSQQCVAHVLSLAARTFWSDPGSEPAALPDPTSGFRERIVAAATLSQDEKDYFCRFIKKVLSPGSGSVSGKATFQFNNLDQCRKQLRQKYEKLLAPEVSGEATGRGKNASILFSVSPNVVAEAASYLARLSAIKAHQKRRSLHEEARIGAAAFESRKCDEAESHVPLPSQSRPLIFTDFKDVAELRAEVKILNDTSCGTTHTSGRRLQPPCGW